MSDPEHQQRFKNRTVLRRVSTSQLTRLCEDHITRETSHERNVYESSRLSSSLTGFSLDEDSTEQQSSLSAATNTPNKSSAARFRKHSFSGPLFVSVPGLSAAVSSPGGFSCSTPPPALCGGSSSQSSPVSSRKQCYSPSLCMPVMGGSGGGSTGSGRQSPIVPPASSLTRSSPLVRDARKRSFDCRSPASQLLLTAVDDSPPSGSFTPAKRGLFTQMVGGLAGGVHPSSPSLAVLRQPVSSSSSSPSSLTLPLKSSVMDQGGTSDSELHNNAVN